MKKIVLSAVAAILALAMTGCSFTSTVTKTETVTDANGNTTIRTSTTTNDNGNITTSETVEVVEATEATEATEAQSELTVATLAFDNRTGLSISGLYFSNATDENWGADIFEGSDPLNDGYTITFTDRFRYNADNTLWDMKIETTEGRAIEFKGLNMTMAADPNYITILMTYDAEANTFSARVE